MLPGSPGTLNPAVLDPTLPLSTPGVMGGAPLLRCLLCPAWGGWGAEDGEDAVGQPRGMRAGENGAGMSRGSCSSAGWAAALGRQGKQADAQPCLRRLCLPARNSSPGHPVLCSVPPPRPPRREWGCAVAGQGKRTGRLGPPRLSPSPIGAPIRPPTKVGPCCNEPQEQPEPFLHPPPPPAERRQPLVPTTALLPWSGGPSVPSQAVRKQHGPFRTVTPRACQSQGTGDITPWERGDTPTVTRTHSSACPAASASHSVERECPGVGGRSCAGTTGSGHAGSEQAPGLGHNPRGILWADASLARGMGHRAPSRWVTG